MKVAVLTAHLSRASGGLHESVPGMVAALEALPGCQVDVIGIRDPRHGDDWKTWGHHVHPAPQWGPRPLGWAPTLGATLRGLAPDVVDSQGLWMYHSLVSLRRARRARLPYVVTPRGMLDLWTLSRSVWKKRIVRAWFEDAHLRQAASLRATAWMECRHIRAFGLRNPVAVVPNGVVVPTAAARKVSADGRRRLLFLSRLHPKKGLPFLLRAWAALAPRHESWELIIAGPDEVGHRGDMQTLARELGLVRLSWLPPVAGHTKDDLYRSADLFVLPTHAENFGLVVAEALAHGVPVITTRHAPWEGLETHGCGWWIDLAHGPLIEALDAAMQLDDETRAAMGGHGRAWMERDFAWPAVARQMLEVYRWVLGGGAPPACVVTD
ncbi:MAG: glycosyltransferase [Rhodospirillales bacterium]|nr:MAG: glycosyltransferase [Rhodospirillales bacterium]